MLCNNRGVGAETRVDAGYIPPIADFGRETSPGRNAFTANTENILLTNLDSTVSVPAFGNQWQSCPGATCTAGGVRASDIVPAGDSRVLLATNFDGASPPGAPTITDVTPRRPRAGEIVRIYGDGFDAINGSPGWPTCKSATLPACTDDRDCSTGPCVANRCPCAIDNPLVRDRNSPTNPFSANRVVIRSNGLEVAQDCAGRRHADHARLPDALGLLDADDRRGVDPGYPVPVATVPTVRPAALRESAAGRRLRRCRPDDDRRPLQRHRPLRRRPGPDDHQQHQHEHHIDQHDDQHCARNHDQYHRSDHHDLAHDPSQQQHVVDHYDFDVHDDRANRPTHDDTHAAVLVRSVRHRRVQHPGVPPQAATAGDGARAKHVQAHPEGPLPQARPCEAAPEQIEPCGISLPVRIPTDA